MFKRFFELWHQEDLLSQAFVDVSDMLKVAKEIYCRAAAPLFIGEPADKPIIYSTDQKINHYEVDVRKKVLEHLSISPEQDTTAALVLITITIDIERLGDYSKNIFELWELHGNRFSDAAVFQRLGKIYSNTMLMFDNTIVAFAEADENLARKVMDSHIENAESCENIIAEMVQGGCNEALPCNMMVLAALTARYLKRISAHLKNVASSVVNPFDRISFKPPDQCEKEVCKYDD